MNEESAAMPSFPRPIFDILITVHDRPCPGLADRKGRQRV
jgi:hypothetical protein